MRAEWLVIGIIACHHPPGILAINPLVAPADHMVRPRPEPPEEYRPVRIAAPRIDGRVDAVESGALLLPRPVPDAISTSEARVHVGWATEVLYVAIDGLDPDETASLAIDGFGAAQAFYRVEVGARVVRAERCGFEGMLPMAVEFHYRHVAAACAPTDRVTAARAEGAVEIAIPWEGLGGLPSEMLRVDAVISGPEGARAGIGRGPVAHAEPGPFGAPPGARKAGLGLDVRPDGWTATLTPRGAHHFGLWRWQLWRHGQVLAEGEADVGVEPVTWAIPGHQVDRVYLLATHDGDAFPRHASLASGAWAHRGMLATPVFTDTLEVAWETAMEAPSVEVVVRDEAGRELASGEVVLEGRSGVFEIAAEASWPDILTVSVPGLLPRDAVAVRVPR